MQGVRDVIDNFWLTIRCSAIGCLIGALPIGGSGWLAYGHAVQCAKDKSSFGKGDVRGVIGPEAANNADTGGSLIPTLIFGIPGGGSAAIFLGGMLLIGFTPGPRMLSRPSRRHLYDHLVRRDRQHLRRRHLLPAVRPHRRS